MLRSITLSCLLLMAAFIPTRAAAQDLGLNIWAMEFAGVAPSVSHIGAYPGLGVSLTFPLDGVSLSPGVGIELAPDTGYWGFMATLAADFPMNDAIGIDAVVAFMHDQLGSAFGDATYYVGAGGGISWFITNQWTLSPNTLVYLALNNGPIWAIAPGANLWYGF
ncbi:hypothetical protein HY632_00205 [Candidatus Uhrbacteria bacterium]|nr:hypothetical protein [Candidatus Uhrbacteria bacterium]